MDPFKHRKLKWGYVNFQALKASANKHRLQQQNVKQWDMLMLSMTSSDKALLETVATARNMTIEEFVNYSALVAQNNAHDRLLAALFQQALTSVKYAPLDRFFSLDDMMVSEDWGNLSLDLKQQVDLRFRAYIKQSSVAKQYRCIGRSQDMMGVYKRSIQK